MRLSISKDIFEELGLAVPNTWEEYLTVGEALKNANHASRSDSRPYLRRRADLRLSSCFGAMAVRRSTRAGNVVIDSPETHAALEFAARFWEAACDPGGLAWDDGSNNRAFLGQTIGATLNGASIYFVARRKDADKYPGLADNCDHFLNPEGPNGRYHFVGPRSLSIMEYSEEKEAAADLIRHFAQDDNFDAFMNVNKGYVQGALPKWERPSDLGVGSGAHDLQGQPEIRPHLRLCRALEPGIRRSAGEIYHRRYVCPRCRWRRSGRRRQPGRSRSLRTSTAPKVAETFGL